MRLTAVACPANTNGASVPAGCTADAGYHGTVTPTTTSPYFAVDGVSGASVADQQATRSDMEQESGPGTCVCSTAYFGTPTFDFATGAWDNPCSTSAVQIAASLGLSGPTVPFMNLPANIATFAAAVEAGIFVQNGRKVS